MTGSITFQIWFKACRPIKRKYNLSTNCLLVLNGSYIYCKFISKDFTRRKLFDFVTYYDRVRTEKYITVLMSHGFIDRSSIFRGRQLYVITHLGIQVIEELNQNYNKELSLFCSLYNISL